MAASRLGWRASFVLDMNLRGAAFELMTDPNGELGVSAYWFLVGIGRGQEPRMIDFLMKVADGEVTGFPRSNAIHYLTEMQHRPLIGPLMRRLLKAAFEAHWYQAEVQKIEKELDAVASSWRHSDEARQFAPTLIESLTAAKGESWKYLMTLMGQMADRRFEAPLLDVLKADHTVVHTLGRRHDGEWQLIFEGDRLAEVYSAP